MTFVERFPHSPHLVFLGGGNMARAIVGGLISSGLSKPEWITVANPTAPKLEQLRADFAGIQTIAGDNRTAAQQADVLVLSVKPNKYESVIAEIKDVLPDGCIVLMIAAGQSIAVNEQRFGKPVKIARVMPNTPALVGEAMSGVSFNTQMDSNDKAIITDILDSFGRAEEIPESLMDAVTGVSGSSPAYVYMVIEAMADAAVLHGMPRPQAYTFAAQAVLGSAKMVLESGQHPGVLKDQVCSPGGTTIEAVAALERGGLRSTIMDAITACIEKSKEMSH